MANLFLRLSSSFACVQVKLDGKNKKGTVFAHIVGGAHFEGARIGFLALVILIYWNILCAAYVAGISTAPLATQSSP